MSRERTAVLRKIREVSVMSRSGQCISGIISPAKALGSLQNIFQDVSRVSTTLWGAIGSGMDEASLTEDECQLTINGTD